MKKNIEIKSSNKFIYNYKINKSENINMDHFESLIIDYITWVFKEENITNQINFYVISSEETFDKNIYKAFIQLGFNIKKELLFKYFMESNINRGLTSSSELTTKKWPIIDELIKKKDFKSKPNLIIDNKGNRLPFKKHIALLLFNKDEISFNKIREIQDIYSEEFSFIYKGWGKEKYTLK